MQVKIKEGDKERLQAFEGLVISKSAGNQPSFTVRKMSFGQGVERIFPLNSKVIDKIEVLRSAHVRRAKLYYLRGLRGKAARLREVDTSALVVAARMSLEITAAAVSHDAVGEVVLRFEWQSLPRLPSAERTSARCALPKS